MTYSFKRLLFSFSLSICVILAKSQTVVHNGLSYQLDLKSKTAALVGISNPPSTSIVIAETVDYEDVSYMVTSIGKKAFYNSSITSVTIPKSVLTVADQAFFNCSSLREVLISDGSSLLTFDSPSSSCFGSSNESNLNLKTLYVGRSFDYTYYSPFSYQPNLTDVTIGSQVSSLPNYFLEHDKALTYISIPSNVQSLGNSAFDSCDNLQTVDVLGEGSLLQSFPSYVFRGCSKLSSITIPSSIRSIEDHAFTFCSSLESIYIPSSVDTVQYCAFDNCSNLKSVVIADGVSSIFFNNQTEGGCFHNCPLESLYLGRSLTKFFNVDPPFGDKPNLKQVTIGGYVSSLDASLFQNDVSLSSIVIPGSVNTINSRVFYNCSSLRSIVFESSDISINFEYPGVSVFKDCPVEDLTIKRPLRFDDTTDFPFANKSSLKTLSFSDNASLSQSRLFSNSAIESLFIDVDFSVPSGVLLFSELPKLRDVKFGEHVTSIPAGVFSDCSALEHITCLPETPPFLDDSNFGGLSLSVLVPDGKVSAYRDVASWDNEGKNLIYSSNEESLSINLDETTLASLAEQLSVAGYLTLSGHFEDSDWAILSGMKQLVSLDLSATDVTFVPAHQFENKNLISLSLPSTVISIGDYAFANNAGLTSDFSFSGNMSIGSNAFAGCSKLANVTFSDPTSDEDEIILSDFAFANTAIGSVSLPASLKSLGIGVWKGCSNLSSVSFADDSRYHVADGVIYDGERTIYQALTGIGDSFEIPSTVKVLAPYAFADLPYLKSVSIPESVLIIGNSCFENCKLSTVKVARFLPLYIDASVFQGVAVDKVNLLVEPTNGKADYSVGYYRNASNECDRYVQNADGTFSNYRESHNNWSVFTNVNGKTVDPSGGDDDGYYSISISSSSNGKVSFSSGIDPSQIQTGQSVTVTFTPDEGFDVETAIVDGSNVTYHLSSYQYTFNMPTHNVSISVQFAPITYSVRLGDSTHGTISADVTSAAIGTVVTLTNTPDAGYVFDSYVSSDVTISADGKFTMPANDVTVSARFVPNSFAVTVEPSDFAQISVSAETAAVGDTIVLSYKDLVSGYEFKSWVIEGATLCNDSCFVMPASNVSVSALFEAINYSITVDQPANGAVTVSSASATAGDTVRIAHQASEGYAFDRWVVDGVTIAPEGYFIMPTNDVTVSAQFVAVLYPITIVPADYGTITCSQESAAIGDTIRISTTLVEGYAFDAWKVEGATVADEGYFIMPAHEVKVSATFKPVLFKINVASPDHGMISCSKSSAFMGDTIRVSYLAVEGYAFDSWLAEDVTFSDEGFFLMPAHDLMLSAKFTAVLHPIMIHQSDYATIVCSKDSAVIGDTVSLYVTDIKPGYSLKGWKVTGVQVSSEGVFTMPSHAVDVMVEFTPIEYTISLKQPDNGHISADKQVAVVGDVVNLSYEATVPGYAFDSWHSADVTISDDGSFVMPAQNVSVTAAFAPVLYPITLQPSDYATIVCGKDSAVVGDTISLQLTDIKPGYSLKGWKVTGVQVSDDGVFTMPSHAVDVMAEFIPIEYTINLDQPANGKITSDKQVAIVGDVVNLMYEENVPGYAFDSWHSEDVAISNDGSFIMPAQDVEVTATFTAVAYPITLQPSDYATIVCSKDSAVVGDTISLQLTDIKPGYSLKGWKVTDVEVSDEGVFTMPAHAVEVMAEFTPIEYTITLTQPENGHISADKQVAFVGDVINLMHEEVVPGYAFDSWYSEDVAISEDGSFLMPAQDVAVTATFTAVAYPITLQPSDYATIVCSKDSAVVGDTISLQVTDIEPGYSLKGWKVTDVEVSDEGVFTMPAHAVEVMAEFAPIEYAITLVQPSKGQINADKQVAFVGDVISLTYEETVEGYAFDKWTFEPFVKIEQNTFIMPASDVKISASYKAIPYVVHVSDLENGTVHLDKETYFVGDLVKMEVEPADGYELVSLFVDGVEILPSFEFAMPAHEVVVEAVFERIHYSIVLSDDFVDGFVFCNGQAYVGANSVYGAVGCNTLTAQEGDEVTLTAYPYLGGKELVFDHWMIEGVTLPVDELSNPVITFIMPAGGVTVSAVFSDITGLAFETVERSAVMRDGGLVLSGLSTNEPIFIYGLNGQLLLNTKADEESIVIPVEDFNTNVVIVKTSNLIKKILIN